MSENILSRLINAAHTADPETADLLREAARHILTQSTELNRRRDYDAILNALNAEKS